MGSSSTIQPGKPGLGSCEFSEIFKRIPFIPILSQPVHEVDYFLSPLPICSHLMVGVALRDRSTIVWEDMTMINQPFRCPMLMPKMEHQMSIEIMLDTTDTLILRYIEYTAQNIYFHLHLEKRILHLTNFFWKRLTAPRIMARPNCRLSSFLAKTGRILFHLPGHCQVPLATCWLQHLEGFQTSKRWAVGVPITKANGRFCWKWPLTKEPLRCWFRIYPEVTFPNRVGNSTWC